MSKIIRIFLKKISLKNIILEAHIFTTSILKPLCFPKWRPIFDDFYSTDRNTSTLFNGMLVGFGPKGMPGRMCDSVR